MQGFEVAAMMRIIPTGETLGATVNGVDLAKPLGARDFAAVLRSANTAYCAFRRSVSTRCS
jgi:hypothetical protein